MSQINSLNVVVLFDIDHTLFNTQEYYDSSFKNYSLHDDVTAGLEALKDLATIGIFSQGQKDLQELKLTKTKISEYFHKEHVHIVEKKHDSMKEVMEKYKDKKVFFVDDVLDVLYNAKQSNTNVFTVWIKRGYYADKQDPSIFTPDATVDTLTDAVLIIKKTIDDYGIST